MKIINTSEKVIGIGNGATILPGESIPAPKDFSINESIAMMIGLGLIKVEEDSKPRRKKEQEKPDSKPVEEKPQKKAEETTPAKE